MSLNNSQINAILKEYDNKRFRHKAILDERTAKIYRELPEYRRIDDELISTSAAFARQAILDPDNFDLQSHQEHINSLTRKKKHILTSAGYPDNYLEMEYDCLKCRDTGYIDNKPCTCFRQATINMLYSQALINTAINTQNFSTFDYSLYSRDHVDPQLNVTPYDNIMGVVKVCNNFVKQLDIPYEERNFKNLLITGNTGVGKTFLSNCIAKAALDEAHSVVYITAQELFNILDKAAFNKDDDEESDAKLDNIEQCDLLIIDDLGSEFATRFTTSAIYSCLNERLLKGLAVVISTNLDFENLLINYSERVYSRIIGEYTPLIIVGNDIRYNKINNK